jgi:hypothetical protein
VLFIGIDRPLSRIVQFAQADDWSITKQTERPRTYVWNYGIQCRMRLTDLRNANAKSTKNETRWLDK